MPRNNRPYPTEFRQQVVELYRSGRSSSELASEFGCHESSITAWAKARNTEQTESNSPLSTSERQELVELRRKLKQVQMERDILAKATAWFANNRSTSTSSTR